MVKSGMTIRYVTAPEDMGAYHTWWMQNAPEGRAAVQSHVGRVCAFIALFCGLMAWLNPSLIPLIVFEALLGIGATMLFSPPGIRRGASAHAVQVYQAAENAKLFGERTLEINEDGVLSVSVNATALYRWELFGSVSATDTHAFLTLGTVTALVIPRDTLAEGNWDAFVAEARRLHLQATQRVRVPAMAH